MFFIYMLVSLYMFDLLAGKVWKSIMVHMLFW